MVSGERTMNESSSLITGSCSPSAILIGSVMAARKKPPSRRIKINRAPVLTLWAAVVAQRLGFDWNAALTLGRAVAGLNAYSKGKALGIFHPRTREFQEKKKKLRAGERMRVHLLGRAVPVVRTTRGLRAATKGRPTAPESVRGYLESKFGEAYATARSAMATLARSRKPQDLAADAYALYTKFRPAIPAGRAGWGAAGILDLGRVRGLARKAH